MGHGLVCWQHTVCKLIPYRAFIAWRCQLDPYPARMVIALVLDMAAKAGLGLDLIWVSKGAFSSVISLICKVHSCTGQNPDAQRSQVLSVLSYRPYPD